MPEEDRVGPTGTAYYENNAQAFFDETIGVDMAPLYERFLAHVPAGGQILNAGCGSGRDALALLRAGYRVEAFDASPTLAALAETHCGLPVQVLRFHDITWKDRFDGIWACASLLHVPTVELPDVLRRLASALKPDGVLYASFKYGGGEREHKGRRFTDLDETCLAELLCVVPEFVELETWCCRSRYLTKFSQNIPRPLLRTPPPPRLLVDGEVRRLSVESGYSDFRYRPSAVTQPLTHE